MNNPSALINEENEIHYPDAVYNYTTTVNHYTSGALSHGT